MSRHTPGPWAVLRDNHDEWIVDLPNERQGPPGRPYMTIPVATVRDNPSDDPDELEANAHLIAAAPLMLQQLEWVARVIDQIAGREPREGRYGSLWQDLRHEAEEARQVIAKAKGEAS